jgi:hypothetical protein
MERHIRDGFSVGNHWFHLFKAMKSRKAEARELQDIHSRRNWKAIQSSQVFPHISSFGNGNLVMYKGFTTYCPSSISFPLPEAVYCCPISPSVCKHTEKVPSASQSALDKYPWNEQRK